MQQWMFEAGDRSEQIPAVVHNIDKLMALFDHHDLPIFDCRVSHKADKSTWSRAMLEQDCAVMIEGTADVAPVAGFNPPPHAHLVTKPANSIFINTNILPQLRQLDVDSLVLCGAFIDGCVGLSAADAEQYGLEVTLVEDAIAHTKISHRPFMFEWLSNMYGLKCQKTADLAEEHAQVS